VTCDLAAIAYLKHLERRLTALLPLTNLTPARPVLLAILDGDLRPTLARCAADLDRMAEELAGPAADHDEEERG
jgi:hypothetical protein